MTKAYQNYFELIDANGLRAAKPCDTYRVSTQLNNAIHLAESAQCYKVNYVAAKDSGGFFVTRPSGAPSGNFTIANRLVFQFPLLMLRQDQYPCFDVRVGITTSDNSVSDVVADIAIGSADMTLPGNPLDFPALPGSIGYLAGATSSSGTSQVVIDGQIVSSPDFWVPLSLRQQVVTDFATGQTWPYAIPMARAVLFTFQTVPNFGFYTIDLVQIREYTPE